MAGLALYAAVGERLAWHDVNVEGATLLERGAVGLPAGVQYAWPHASRRFLYVACSNGRPGDPGTRHFIAALRVGHSGGLSPHGDPIPVRSRPVHLCTDLESRHALVVFPAPSDLGVYRIGADGQLGAEVRQDGAPFRLGKTAHQVRMLPSGNAVVVPVRGTDAAPGRAEDPGSLEFFDYRNGKLAHRQTLAPGGGFGFGPRHVDFHPSQPWMYLSIERQNEIAVFRLGAGGVEGPEARVGTLEHPEAEKPRQLVGAIHVHPSGRFAYVSNRADGTVDVRGEQVFNGAENSIAVFSLDEGTGRPTRIQNADTRGMHARTFHIDPSGRLLVAASMTHRRIREGDAVREVPAGLSVFRIGADGRLAFERKYDAHVGSDLMFWAGMLPLP